MVRSYVVSKEGVKMINIIECDDYESAKNLILDYSKIKGAEACFVSLDKELSDFIKAEPYFLAMRMKSL